MNVEIIMKMNKILLIKLQKKTERFKGKILTRHD